MGLFTRQPSGAVERLARSTGAGSKPDRGSRHFLVLVAMIVLAGSTMVGLARAERQYDHPTLFDSWQNAYGVFDCTSEDWLAPFENLENPNGIRTRGDGVIYIEPTVEEATGNRARLGLFLDNVGVELTDSTLRLPDGTVLDEQDAWCRGEEAVLQVIRWTEPRTDPAAVEIRTENLAQTRFLNDGEAFAIALAPLGANLPTPPSVASLPETPTEES